MFIQLDVGSVSLTYNSYLGLLTKRDSCQLRMFSLLVISCIILPASLAEERLTADVRSILGDPQSDAYIDQILENLRQMILDQALDPMVLPDLETGFSDTILGELLSPTLAQHSR